MFKNYMYNGPGKYVFHDEKIYEGIFINDVF
jgi:hypothetical protein